MKRKSKRFIRHLLVEYRHDIPEDIFDIFIELGFIIYEDPTMSPQDSDMAYFISNRPLTYRWLLKHAKSYNVQPKWFKRAFADEIKQNKPLDEK